MSQFPDWFSAYAKPNFEKYLRPMAGQPLLKFLQLGVYTGDATEWLMDNILTGPSSTLQDVDTWEGSDEEVHETIDFNQVYKVYDKRVKRFNKSTLRVLIYRGLTTDFLTHDAGCCDCSGYQYDFIYIDADHTAAGVLVDAELSWGLLKSGGIMAFDDYQWGSHLHSFKSPKLGIDLFLERHAGEYELLESGLQVWIRRL